MLLESESSLGDVRRDDVVVESIDGYRLGKTAFHKWYLDFNKIEVVSVY